VVIVLLNLKSSKHQKKMQRVPGTAEKKRSPRLPQISEPLKIGANEITTLELQFPEVSFLLSQSRIHSNAVAHSAAGVTSRSLSSPASSIDIQHRIIPAS
jgi:hypothetical protein